MKKLIKLLETYKGKNLLDLTEEQLVEVCECYIELPLKFQKELGNKLTYLPVLVNLHISHKAINELFRVIRESCPNTICHIIDDNIIVNGMYDIIFSDGEYIIRSFVSKNEIIKFDRLEDVLDFIGVAV